MIWLKLPAPSADAVLALDDGKVLVAGAENGGRSAILVRLLPDGTPDAAFGASGVVESFTGRFGTATKAIALQPDGKVLVAGSSRTTGTAGRITVARHLAGGELDPSFGVAGVVIAEYPGREAFANALTVRTDGRIIVGGTSEDAQTPAGTSDFEVLRLNSDGTADATFGVSGRVTLDMRGTSDEGGAIALGPAGAITIAGRSKETSALSGRFDFAAARLKDDGSLDTSFGNAGKFISAFGAGSQLANDVVLTPSGAAILTGWTNADFALIRLSAAGTLDPSFGTSGLATVDFGGRGDASLKLVLQADGRILAVGNSGNGSQPDTYGASVARLLPNGALDPTFGSAGRTFVPPPANSRLSATAVSLTRCTTLVAGTWEYDLGSPLSKSAIGVLRMWR
ncbi:MAG: hypothetical protein IPK71_12845 [Myxococcales bacterium]|nr:hypothetical protein [Myxococcales bacterium]